MRKTIKILAAVLLATSSLLATSADAPAQPGWWADDNMMNGPMLDGRMMEGEFPAGMMGHRGMAGMMRMMSNPMVQARLAYVKAELEITDAQAPAWTAYSDATIAQVDSMRAMHDTMFQTMKSASALERMDARIKAMEAMIEGLRAMKPAAEALYKVLTAEQQKKADVLLTTGMM